MKKKQIIEFDSKERILEKARRYVDSLELFFEEGDKAIPLLLKAIKYADKDLKREIILLLGSFAKEKVAWPLYDLLCDKSEGEDARNHAAIQLSVIGPFLKNPRPLMDRLLKDMESSDPELRLHATFKMDLSIKTFQRI